MTFRDACCQQCRQSTGGDCGQHGVLILQSVCMVYAPSLFTDDAIERKEGS